MSYCIAHVTDTRKYGNIFYSYDCALVVEEQCFKIGINVDTFDEVNVTNSSSIALFSMGFEEDKRIPTIVYTQDEMFVYKDVVPSEEYIHLNGYDSADVHDITTLSYEFVEGIKFIKVECQHGMYFEIKLEVLRDAICVFNLPFGIKYDKEKIYGTPMSHGIFTSFIYLSPTYIVEFIMYVGELSRVL